MKRTIRAMVGAVAAIGFAVAGGYAATINGVDVVIHPESEPVVGSLVYDLAPMDGHMAEFSVDGVAIAGSRVAGRHVWKPQSIGQHIVAHTVNGMTMSATYNVTALDYWTQPEPNPPMPVVDSISITPVTREIPQGGGGAAILTSGSGDWTAAASDSWITLNATSGTAGSPVAYVVSINPDVEDRVGYVYVAGRVHTVTQKGLGGTVSTAGFELERDGGTETVAIEPSDTRSSWKARSNNDWISVSPTGGTGPGMVTVQVAPWYKVSTRSGSVTIGGKTVTVYQYGSRMTIEPERTECDYLPQAIPVLVNALAVTQWSVTPNASWLSVVDAGNGRGGDTVTIAAGENPSYKARTGTVTIGTETLTVVQDGRKALEFAVSPGETTAAVSGANGLASVRATPDLPWSVGCDANWITIVPGFQSGAGNGNVVYTVSPQSTLYDREGTVTVTPEAESGMLPRTHKVKQPAAASSLSSTGYEFAASGETMEMTVTVNDIVEWKIENLPSWLTVAGSLNRVGPGVVALSAAENDTVEARSAEITMARKTFRVSQKARGVEVEYDNKLFGTDGGSSSVSIHPDGNVTWTAVASDDWIVIWQNASGTGDSELQYIVAPYTGDGSARTGTITVGDKTVYITQRGYDLDISPRADWVTGNAGAGEIAVSASIGDVWSAIATAPWITIVTEYDAGTGNGTVRFTYTDNDTGKTRSGKILIAGEAYELTQAARVAVAASATATRGGRVSGAGDYTQGETATLTAVADAGYEFLYWTGSAGETMQNPLTLTMDTAKSVTAHFGALAPEFTSCESTLDGVKLKWGNLAWATQYKIYRAPTSQFPSEALAMVEGGASCVYLDTTGETGRTYFYWVEAIGEEDRTESATPASGMKQKPIVYSSITYTNLKGASHTNPARYEEGKALTFISPGKVTGYTFTGWSPAQITADMTGAKTVTANWRANGYSIAYNANGGSGEMDETSCTYSSEAEIAANGFVRSGYVFAGWALEPDGAVVYAAGEKVENLTSNDGGVVTLYAVWEYAPLSKPAITPADGSEFFSASCTVSITCEGDGVEIYYTTNGRTPRFTEQYRYKGPFQITGTATIVAIAVRGETESDVAEATITKGDIGPLTLNAALDEAKLAQVTSTGDALWTAVQDDTAKIGHTVAKSGAVRMNAESMMETKVFGQGTLSFWWKVSCEDDPRGRYTYDHVRFEADGEVKARLDGETGWEQVTVTFGSAGVHTLTWTYATDDWEEPGYQDCAWVDGVVWSGSEMPSGPSVAGDSGAVVTGDAESGYVVKPGDGNRVVEVTVPEGMDAAKVTVEVAPETVSVKPNGAAVKIVREANGTRHDITGFLDLPAAVDGVVNVNEATVKEEYAKEPLDVAKGAVVTLGVEEPVIRTAPTRAGLTYKFYEGATLDGLFDGEPSGTKIGDGEKWAPGITVKGGRSGFYSIKVEK